MTVNGAQWFRFLHSGLLAATALSAVLLVWVGSTLIQSLRLFAERLLGSAEACGCEPLPGFSSQPLFYTGLSVATVVVFAAIILFVTHVVLLSIRTRRAVCALPTGGKTTMKLNGKRLRLVYVQSAHPILFTAGILHPRIYTSFSLSGASGFASPEHTAALLHEYAHVQHHHPLKKLMLFAFIRTLLFPWRASLTRAVETAQELIADREVIQLGYKRALLSALSQFATSSAPAGTAAFQVNNLRMHQLLSEPIIFPMTPMLAGIALGVFMLIGTSLSAYAFSPKESVLMCRLSENTQQSDEPSALMTQAPTTCTNILQTPLPPEIVD